MNDRVHCQIEDGVARIQMDDGKVNALSTGMFEELDRAFDEAEKAGAVTVLSGREGIFSAGFDLPTFGRGREATLAMVGAGVALIERLLGFPRPVLTVCTGHAYPMGAFLMLSADLRLGVTGPWRIGMNEVAIGMTVPKFAVELARHRLSPPAVARITTAALFDPEEAARHGYLDRVLAPEHLAEAVEEEVARLLALDAGHFAATKPRINERAIRAVRAAAEEELRSAWAASAPAA